MGSGSSSTAWRERALYIPSTSQLSNQDDSKSGHIIQLIKLNNKEFVAIQLYANNGEHRKYNVDTNQWTQWKVSTNGNIEHITAAAYNHDQDTFYIYNGNSFNIINATTKKRETYELVCIGDPRKEAKLFVINDRYHKLEYFDSRSSFSHCRWYTEDFGFICHISDPLTSSIVPLKHKQKILIFTHNEKKGHKMHIWDPISKSNSWEVEKIHFPHALIHGFTGVAVNNDDYVIILGVCGGGIKVNNLYGVGIRTDDIYVFDVNKMELKRSTIKSPMKKGFELPAYHVMVMDCDRDYKFLLISSYIRRILRTDRELLGGISDDVIGTIAMFYTEEFLHLMVVKHFAVQFHQNHWKISVKSILNSVK